MVLLNKMLMSGVFFYRQIIVATTLTSKGEYHLDFRIRLYTKNVYFLLLFCVCCIMYEHFGTRNKYLVHYNYGM